MALLPGELLARMAEASGEQGVPSPLVHGRDPFSVLVGTIVSLRTRDTVTEKVTEKLLTKLPDAASMAAASTRQLADLLFPAGFFNRKAEQLKRMAVIIENRYGGAVPDTRDDLEALPGVGGKTAAFVLSMAFGKPAICVDVHVHRISNRLGIVNTSTPGDTEKALMKLFLEDQWIPLNHVFVRFGQRVCRPLNPVCTACPFKDWCENAS